MQKKPDASEQERTAMMNKTTQEVYDIINKTLEEGY
jgi:hypothetical protein